MPPGDAGDRAEGRARLAPAVALLLLAAAYGPLLLGDPAALFRSAEAEMFRPWGLPMPLALGAAAWLAWRRRGRLAARPAPGRWLAWPLAALGGGAFVWSHLTGAAHVLAFSLTLNLLAFGAASGGLAGLGATALPAAVLALGVPLPDPLRSEIVWQLQLVAAASAGWLLDLAGRGFEQHGVLLEEGEVTVHVIDGCSGYQGMLILTLVAILVRELFPGAGRRRWWLLALAPALGFALNALRVALVALGPDPGSLVGPEADHAAQGLLILAVGTALLYAAGWALASTAEPSSCAATGERGALAWRATALWLAVLLAIVAALPAFPARSRSLPVPEFAEARAGWSAEPLDPDPYFFGPPLRRYTLHRRYDAPSEREIEMVELLVRVDADPRLDASAFFTSRLAIPGPAWDLESRRRTLLGPLDQAADLSIASRGGDERAVVYSWTLPAEGLWWASWRALWSLDASPLRRDEPRRAVQLVAYSPRAGPRHLDRARRRLDRFVEEFRAELAAL